MELKITRGEWKYYYPSVNQFSDLSNTFTVCLKGDPLILAKIEIVNGNLEEAEANAQLISEAGTVANETGKTPRQLADLNKELLEALIKLKSSHQSLYSKLSTKWKNEVLDYNEMPSVIKANEVIQKAQ